MYRTGQRFGAGYVIDVLRGSDSERIRSFGHRRLSTFGIGGDIDATTWRSVFRQLVARGLMRVDIEGFGALKLTEASRSVLRGACEVRLRRDAPAPRKRRRESPAQAARTALGPEHQALFDALRARRRELAREQGVPPYVIFHDVTLEAMAERQPRTLEAFAALPGVGEKKLERYATTFIKVVFRPRLRWSKTAPVTTHLSGYPSGYGHVRTHSPRKSFTDHECGLAQLTSRDS